MSIADSFNKKTIIVLIVLAVIGGAAAAYLLYFKDMGTPPTPETEKIAKRIKIETPASEEKNEAVKPTAVKTQTPTPSQPQPEVSHAKPEAVKPAEVKPEIKKKEEIKLIVEKKPSAQESASEKKLVAKKKKQELIVTAKKAAYKSWAVHIASYVSREEAEAMAKRLKQDRYNAYITEFNMKGKHWYRVRVGFYSSKQVADEVGKKLSFSYNLSGIWVVKPIKKEIMSHIN